MEFSDTERFEILRLLGEGSNGVVYEALDRETQLKVALKTLRSPSPETLFAFKREFRSIQNLAHPNLVELYDLTSAHGTWFFTMELVEGVDFLDHVRPRAGKPRPATGTGAQPPNPNRKGDTLVMGEASGPAAGRRGGELDEARLRASLVQLTRGLMALHEAGKVHRDIKPSNIRVTPQGRVVLLDFGLTADLEARTRAGDDGEVVGTVAYMAPEQAASRTLTPAADWYAVGVMLFEALTGALPLEGEGTDLLSAKQTLEPPDPRALAPQAPPDLAQLCRELLRLDPNARPQGRAILARLTSPGELDPVWSTPSLGGQVFVGRRDELEALSQALHRVRAEGPQCVCLHGETGLGKSTLVRRFLKQLQVHASVPMVLEGACDERESMPFRGIDGALDSLAQVLAQADPAWVQDCLPEDAGLLAQFFPVLSRVPALAQVLRPALGEASDPTLVRQRLFEALRQLLAWLAVQRPLVVVLEDVQWAGGDTWALLRHVFRGAHAPPLLLVMTARADESGLDEVLRRRITELTSLSTKWLELRRLSPEESRSLASQLLERLGAPSGWQEQIAAEAGGHPLLLDALVRGGLGTHARSLDEMLLRRVQALEPVPRRVLGLVCVSNAPVVQQAVAAAAGLDFKAFMAQVAVLKVARLVRATGVRGQDLLQALHDRVRVVVIRSLSEGERQALHQQLAMALLAAPVPDHEAMAWHFAQSGQTSRAASHAELAADQAMERLAFDRAARLYRQALAAGPGGSSLQERLGEALLGAGRGAEAGEAFEVAAATSESVRSLELTRRAAHEFLRSGRIDAGLARLQEVLASVGERLVQSPLAALVSLLLGRARIFFRGLGFKERSVKQVPASELLRIDATWAASEALSMVDVVRGAYMQTRHTLLALRAGEPMRVARSLAVEAGLVASEGTARRARAREIHGRGVEIAARVNDTATSLLLTAIDGVIEFQVGDFASARERMQRAIKLMQAESRGVRFELTNARLFWLVSLLYLGSLREFLQAIPELLEESESTGDRFGLTNYRLNHCNAAWLARDDVEAARAQVASARLSWSSPGYQTLDYYALLAEAQIGLYCGDARTAHARVLEDWPKLTRSLLTRVQVLRVEALQLRGRTAWAAGEEADARACLRRLRRERHPLATGLAATLTLAMASPRGEDAARDEAEQALARGQLGLLHQAARLWREPEGPARQWFLELGVKRPEAFLEVLIPSRAGAGGRRSPS